MTLNYYATHIESRDSMQIEAEHTMTEKLGGQNWQALRSQHASLD